MRWQVKSNVFRAGWPKIAMALNSDKVELVNAIDDARWNPFVESHPHGTIYQHSSWMRVIALTYKHAKPLCFVIEDFRGNIRAALPCFAVKSKLTGTRIVSLPFTSYCDPLVSNKVELAKLFDAIVSTLEDMSASYYELRGLKCLELIKEQGLKPHDYYKTHILDLEGGFGKVRKAFHRDSVVITVRKAVKCGVMVREASSEQDLKKFYFIHATTRKRLGFPIQPFKFFQNMFEILHPQGYFTMLLAELNGTAIAGLILFKFKDTVSLEHIGSIPKYLLSRPNHLLFWKAIEMACSEGYRYCDFGKTPIDNKGLLDFKRRWGAKMYDLPYFYYPKIRGAMSLKQNDFRHKLLRSMGKYTPLPLAKIMGEIAYHHLG